MRLKKGKRKANGFLRRDQRILSNASPHCRPSLCRALPEWERFRDFSGDGVGMKRALCGLARLSADCLAASRFHAASRPILLKSRFSGIWKRFRDFSGDGVGMKCALCGLARLSADCLAASRFHAASRPILLKSRFSAGNGSAFISVSSMKSASARLKQGFADPDEAHSAQAVTAQRRRKSCG